MDSVKLQAGGQPWQCSVAAAAAAGSAADDTLVLVSTAGVAAGRTAINAVTCCQGGWQRGSGQGGGRGGGAACGQPVARELAGP